MLHVIGTVASITQRLEGEGVALRSVVKVTLKDDMKGEGGVSKIVQETVVTMVNHGHYPDVL